MCVCVCFPFVGDIPNEAVAMSLAAPAVAVAGNSLLPNVPSLGSMSAPLLPTPAAAIAAVVNQPSLLGTPQAMVSDDRRSQQSEGFVCVCVRDIAPGHCERVR